MVLKLIYIVLNLVLKSFLNNLNIARCFHKKLVHFLNEN